MRPRPHARPLQDVEDVFRRRDHPGARGVDSALRRGQLISLYPGVLVSAQQAITLETLVRAAALVDPDAVIVGEGARSLGWAEHPVTSLQLATPRQLGGRSKFLRFERRQVPLEFVIEKGDLRFTSPECTAVDLIPTRGGEVVDDVLRLAGERSADSLALMWTAFHAQPNRRGNSERQRILVDSRDRPWSEAERELHQLLRSFGFTGWETNHRVVMEQVWYIDVAFPKERVAIEFDSWKFHSDRWAFERDRLKANELQAAEWTVLQVTWDMLAEPERLRRWIEQALRRRG